MKKVLWAPNPAIGSVTLWMAMTVAIRADRVSGPWLTVVFNMFLSQTRARDPDERNVK